MAKSGTVRLNRAFFSADRLKTNKHQLAQSARLSYPTILRYLGAADVENFNGEVLYRILMAGFGYTPESAADLRLGDVFDIVPNGDPS